jgi:chromosome segregation ATPase
VFGRENEHLFLRHIVGFIPRTRFEEGKDEIEEKELLLEQVEEQERALKKAQEVFKESNTAMLQAQAQLKQAQDKVIAAQAHAEQAEAQQVQLQARIDALEQAQLSRRIEDSERGFPSESSNSGSEGPGMTDAKVSEQTG